MEMSGVQLDPEVRAGLARSWKGLMAVGIAAILVGCVAIVVPAVASVGTAIFIGWVLVIVGAFLVAGAFAAHTVGSVIWRLLWAFLTVIVGLWLILEPHNGTLTLTLVLGIYFLLMGITRIAVAFGARGQQGAGLVGLSGVAGLLIGILVLAKFPSSADWAIGLLVGIDLIFAGWTLVSVALLGKDLARGSSHSGQHGSGGSAPFAYELKLDFPPSEFASRILGMLSGPLANLGYAPTIQIEGSASYARRYSPWYFILLYIIFFPIGLLLLLARPIQTVAISWREEGEGDSLAEIHGVDARVCMLIDAMDNATRIM